MTSIIHLTRMSGQGYKRTNFDEEETSDITPPSMAPDHSVTFKTRSTLCQRRSFLERVLCGVSLFFMLLSLILILVLVNRSHREESDAGKAGSSGSKQNSDGERVVTYGTQRTTTPTAATTTTTTTTTRAADLCLTPTCVTAAGSMLAAMDTSVDPCDDFYEYACGGWRRDHPIPAGHSSWETFGVMWMKNQIQMLHTLEKPLSQSESDAENKTKLYYASCIDKSGIIQKLGAAPLLHILSELGGWGVTDDNWPGDTRWELQTMLQRIHSMGFFSLFSGWVGEDDKQPEQNIFLFDQGGLGLSREQYMNKTIENDTILTGYLDFMTTVGVLLGGEKNRTRELMKQVVQFEMSLAEIMTPQENRTDSMKLYHKMSLDQLQKISSFIVWKDYINSLLSVTSYQVSGSEEVVVYAPEYLAKLATLVQDTLQADDGNMILNNYMLWHVVKGMCLCLSRPFVDAHKKFMHLLTGVRGNAEHWRECVSDVDGTLGFALGAMFIRESFHGASKETAETMIQAIKESFKTNLKTLDWIDEETRQAANEKADAMGDMIGFPAYIMNATALDEKYKDLEVNAEEYFLNNLRDQKFMLKKNLVKLRKPPNKNSWSMTPATVNAYYMPNRNKIIFPAGILQPPFYNQQFPKALNFGGMGIVMGHELTHAFDDQGREFDKFGRMRKWWNNETIERFTERAQCIVNQYSNYSIHDEHLKGKLTLGENIADNGGLKCAYHAYENWLRTHGEERHLPGLNMTNRQLFFLSSAQVWCSNSKAKGDHLSIMRDPHSLSRFRVIGPLSNLPAFSEQFGCPVNSPMNPKQKCEVW